MFNYDKITFIENQLNNIQVIFTNSSAKDTFGYEFLDSKGDVIDTPEDITVNLTKSVGRCVIDFIIQPTYKGNAAFFRLLYRTNTIRRSRIPFEAVKEGFQPITQIIPKLGGEYTFIYGFKNERQLEQVEATDCTITKRLNNTRSWEITYSVGENTDGTDRTVDVTLSWGLSSVVFEATQKGIDKPTINITPGSWSANTDSTISQRFDITVTGDTLESYRISSLPAWISETEKQTNYFILTAKVNPSVDDIQEDLKILITTTGWGPTIYNIPITQKGHNITLQPNIVVNYTEQTIKIDYTANWLNESYLELINKPEWIEQINNLTFKVSENQDKTRSGYITFNVVVDNQTIQTVGTQVYQLEKNKDNIPIWREEILKINTNTEWIEYHIDTIDNLVLYAGKAYKEPNKDYIAIPINEICSNYINQIEWPEYGLTYSKDYIKTFIIKTSLGDNYIYQFKDDWSYGRQRNIPGRWLGNKSDIIITGKKGDKLILPDKEIIFNDYQTYRQDLSNYICGSVISFNEFKWTITDLNAVLYYTNKQGIWQFLGCSANVLQTDDINSYTAKENPFKSFKYANTIERTWEINTSWLKGDLADLFSSLNVYLWFSGDYIPVQITNSSAEYKNYTNNGKHLVSYKINVKAVDIEQIK